MGDEVAMIACKCRRFQVSVRRMIVSAASLDVPYALVSDVVVHDIIADAASWDGALKVIRLCSSSAEDVWDGGNLTRGDLHKGGRSQSHL